MSRKYIEARKLFTGFTSDRCADNMDMNGDGITLTLKCPVGQSFHRASPPASSLGGHYLSLAPADHRYEDVQQAGDLPYQQRRGYAVSVSQANKAHNNPFVYQPLDTVSRDDQEEEGDVISDGDAAQDSHSPYRTPSSACGYEEQGKAEADEAAFLTLHTRRQMAGGAARDKDGLDETGQSSPFAEERSGNVTEYAFMDVKSAVDPCPMLFGKKLTPAENSCEKQEGARKEGCESPSALAAADKEVSKESCSRSEQLIPFNTASAAAASEREASLYSKPTSASAAEQRAVEDTSKPSLGGGGKVQSGPPKRAGRIIKLPASLVGGSFDDKPAPEPRLKKRGRTGVDRDSMERELPKTRTSRDRGLGTDVEEEKYGRSVKSLPKRDDAHRQGRRVSFVPSKVISKDMSDVSFDVRGPGGGRSVFNRITVSQGKETVFDRLSYGRDLETAPVDRNYTGYQHLQDAHGISCASKTSSHSTLAGSSSRGFKTDRPGGQDVAYYEQHQVRDYHRLSDKLEFTPPFASPEIHVATRDTEANGKILQHSKTLRVASWERGTSNRALYFPRADRTVRRSCSPEGKVSAHGKRMRVRSPSYPSLGRNMRGRSHSPDYHVVSSHGVGGSHVTRESRDGYSDFQSSDEQLETYRMYGDGESSVLDRRMSRHGRPECLVTKASITLPTDILEPGKLYPRLSGVSDSRDQSAKRLVQSEEDGDGKIPYNSMREPGSDWKSGKLGNQALMKDWSTTDLRVEKTYAKASRGFRGSRDRAVYDPSIQLDLHDNNYRQRRTRNVPPTTVNRHVEWEERDGTHLSVVTRHFPSAEHWPAQIPNSRYRGKVCS